MMRKSLIALLLTFGFLIQTAVAQVAPSILAGDVSAIDQTAKQIVLKTKDGLMIVNFDDKTDFRRVTPENPDPKAAVAAAQSDIAAGDKIVAVVLLSEDKKNVTATRRVILMTQKDIAKKQANDQERWTTRGVAGRVTAVNPAANEITVAVRGGFGGDRTMTVAASDKTTFRRYAPNSVRYSEAKTSNFNEIKIGDQLRATGEKTADNARLAAEEIISGSFRMVVGKVEAVNAAAREVTIKDAQTNKSVVIAVNDNTLLRRFPEEMAQRMAQFQAMRASGQMPQGGAMMQRPNANQGGQNPANGQAQNQPTPNGQAPQAMGQGAGQGQGMGGGMMRGNGGARDVDALLESMPALNLTDLKVGDAVAASSSAGDTPDRVTAIKFVAGVEPFLNQPQAPQAGGGQQGGRGQSAPSFNIPGLDSIGAP